MILQHSVYLVEKYSATEMFHPKQWKGWNRFSLNII